MDDHQFLEDGNYLFKSNKLDADGHNRPISRVQGYGILNHSAVVEILDMILDSGGSIEKYIEELESKKSDFLLVLPYDDIENIDTELKNSSSLTRSTWLF